MPPSAAFSLPPSSTRILGHEGTAHAVPHLACLSNSTCVNSLLSRRCNSTCWLRTIPKHMPHAQPASSRRQRPPLPAPHICCPPAPAALPPWTPHAAASPLVARSASKGGQLHAQKTLRVAHVKLSQANLVGNLLGPCTVHASGQLGMSAALSWVLVPALTSLPSCPASPCRSQSRISAASQHPSPALM